VTRTGERFLTPRYVTPEQIEGKPADQRSDVYAVGLILYEMFTGTSAFASVSSRLTDLPSEPREFDPDIPAHVNRIVMRCLQRNPELRYRNAQEIIADFDAEHVSAS
jgi:serine/threonine protein kinase